MGSSFAMIAKGELQMALLLIPTAMAVFGYFLMKKLVFDLMDEVWDDGDMLIVKNKNKEDRIPLSEIMNISYSYFTNPPRVTLTLRHPCCFGTEVTFSAPISFIPFGKSPIIDELILRVDAKRRG
ncbi:MAG: hypothetical protein HZC10_09640 [Nitrospirae bacterium]|nr:hypothetical protein [Nitrospirota bacterium]